MDILGFRSKPWALPLPDGQRVEISSIPLHLGGVRRWLHCPDCNRRCTVLYGSSCRLCLGAVHRITTLSPRDRLIERAVGLRKRTGQGGAGLLVPFPPQPQGMYSRAYRGLRMQCHEVEQRLWRLEAERWGLLDEDDSVLAPEQEQDGEP